MKFASAIALVISVAAWHGLGVEGRSFQAAHPMATMDFHFGRLHAEDSHDIRRGIMLSKRPRQPPSTAISSSAAAPASASVLSIPRGGASAFSMVRDASSDLTTYMKGPKSDVLLLLLTTALNTPICQKFQVSPILGYLSLGLLFGPNGRGLIKDIHTTEMMADLGIVLFLFEMGIHLDFETLMAMKRDVFGIGLSQFTITAIVIAGICKFMLGFSTPAMIIIGWSLALSSSAFVLQLLKDKGEMNSQYGKSSFGTLLLQDLMVVPLLVITPILAGNGGSPGEAVAKALVQITMALSCIGLFGKTLLSPMLDLVADSESKESFIGLILSIVLGMSFLTEGLGLSNTLGAFLSGMLIAETRHRHHVEVEASPFRGILVGLFFFTVGFEIDVKMILSKPGIIVATVAGILAIKATIATAVCRKFDLPMSTAQRVGLVLSQGGEFAFVAFRTARNAGILKDDETKMLLTCVSLTMALTPMLEDFGAKAAIKQTETEVTSSDIQTETETEVETAVEIEVEVSDINGVM